jgi:hypothetical protein
MYDRTVFADAVNKYNIVSSAGVTLYSNVQIVFSGSAGGTALSASNINSLGVGIIRTQVGSYNFANLTYDATSAVYTFVSYYGTTYDGTYAGLILNVIATATNTGACTLKVDARPAKSIKKNGALNDLEAGDIVSGRMFSVMDDGTYYQMCASSMIPRMHSQTFTVGTTGFTAQVTGPHKVTVQAGGGGGVIATAYAQGGGGGAAIGYTNLVKGTVYNFVVGSGGGTASAGATVALSGSSTSFSGISATGGTGAQSGGLCGTGGTGGVGSGGLLNIYGCDGNTYATSGSTVYLWSGGSARAALGTVYGRGGYAGAAGQDGIGTLEWLEF